MNKEVLSLFQNKFFNGHTQTPVATRRYTEIDLAWAAGFLEGEGGFISTKTPGIYAVQLHQEPLLRLQSLFGGSITAHWTRGKRYNSWAVTGERARLLMGLLLPMMSSRRKTAIRRALAMKRRSVKGSRNPHAKLNEKQVKHIRSLFSCGISPKHLALKYSVHVGTVREIIRGELWGHV